MPLAIARAVACVAASESLRNALCLPNSTKDVKAVTRASVNGPVIWLPSRSFGKARVSINELTCYRRERGREDTDWVLQHPTRVLKLTEIIAARLVFCTFEV